MGSRNLWKFPCMFWDCFLVCLLGFWVFFLRIALKIVTASDKPDTLVSCVRGGRMGEGGWLLTRRTSADCSRGLN